MFAPSRRPTGQFPDVRSLASSADRGRRPLIRVGRQQRREWRRTDPRARAQSIRRRCRGHRSTSWSLTRPGAATRHPVGDRISRSEHPTGPEKLRGREASRMGSEYRRSRVPPGRRGGAPSSEAGRPPRRDARTEYLSGQMPRGRRYGSIRAIRGKKPSDPPVSGEPLFRQTCRRDCRGPDSRVR